MTVKAKRFRIGVEGATTDGREIQREWLVQMAASYNPTVYTALINLEHIKSYLPDSTFNRYGRVTGLVAEEIKDGPLAGKMALYADIEPTDALVELVKKGQKLFTSMEVSTKFADTGKAYCQCQNINCGSTFVTHETVVRYIVTPGLVDHAPPHPLNSGQGHMNF
ncbi:TPA: hypothetical protein MBE84_001098 [Klebsiella aerogenes]|nr:hypothetical protein [Klebsiella aerogenes]